MKIFADIGLKPLVFEILSIKKQKERDKCLLKEINENRRRIGLTPFKSIPSLEADPSALRRFLKTKRYLERMVFPKIRMTFP